MGATSIYETRETPNYMFLCKETNLYVIMLDNNGTEFRKKKSNVPFWYLQLVSALSTAWYVMRNPKKYDIILLAITHNQ